MKSCRSVLSVSVAVVGLLALSACGGEKPSGLPEYTGGASKSPPSPTSTSKWTIEQQQVIDSYDRYSDLVTRILTKAEKIDLAKAHRVAMEPFATTYLERLDATLSAGFVQTGRVVNTISSVTVTGGKAIVKTCQDQTHTKLINPGDASVPTVRTLPPALATVTLVREGDVWLVAGFKGDEGACVSG